MRPVIYATSDLHGYLPEPKSVPDCDILLIAGDTTPATDHSGWYQKRWINTVYRDWLYEVAEGPTKRIVIEVAGNHDFIYQEAPDDLLKLPRRYLQDGAAILPEWGLFIYGTPWTPTFGGWAFMRDDRDLEQVFNKIPAGVDILVSHGPPLGLCDRNVMGSHCGSHFLARRIREVWPSVVVCGHIHEAFGMAVTGAETEDGPCQTEIYNVSRVNFNYQPVNPFVEIQLQKGKQ